MAFSGRRVSEGLAEQVESAALNLVQLISRNISSPNTVNSDYSLAPTAPPVLSHSPAISSSTPKAKRVQEQLTRQFPGIFQKKRQKCHHVGKSKCTNFYMYALPEPTSLTPKGTEELKLAQAGLGKRQISLMDDGDHQEASHSLLMNFVQIERVLHEEFPKLKTLTGGWMFYKALGGSGQRKLSIIPTENDGYSVRLLKTASNNGKNLLYVVPLQEEMSTNPLPPDAPVFSKMPRACCKTCNVSMPLQLLALHIQECQMKSESDEQSEAEITVVKSDEEDVNDHTEDEQLGICPICQGEFSTDVLPVHASLCIERSSLESIVEHPGTSQNAIEGTSLGPRSSFSRDSTTVWKTEPCPKKASKLFVQEICCQNEENPSLTLTINVTDDLQEQDSAVILFYKQQHVNWAAPVKFNLKGDAAVGKGVTRHVFSLMMNKLKSGFNFNMGNASVTKLFDGEADHLVPSASTILVESDLFTMAGRLIGHSCLHGGPTLSGLSPAFICFLTGGSQEEISSLLCLEDCPDLDHRETIALLCLDRELSEEEKAQVLNLCLAWDLPGPTKDNRVWLFQNLLMHAVITRVGRQTRQLRKGLKETKIWPLVTDRRDVVSLLFPKTSEVTLSPQDVFQCIKWPAVKEQDDDDDDDEWVPMETVTRITGFLKTFISEASPEDLRDLVKFWTGWEVPSEVLHVELTSGRLPTAATCFEKLRLPTRYLNFYQFKDDMIACLRSVNTGFGLV